MADSTATTKHIGDLIVTKKNAASVAYITEVTGDLYIRADDHLAREQAMRERDYERRRAAHPDPSDPEHPDELEGAI